MSEWISVNDRLPELSGSCNRANVICATDSGDVRQMVYIRHILARTEKGRKPRWEEVIGQLAWSTVTHWMPLPDHPSKSGSKSS